MKLKIGVLMICVNDLFWPYAKEGHKTAKEHFFKGHEVEFMLWTDIPKPGSPAAIAALTKAQPRADLEAAKPSITSAQQFNAFVNIPVREEIQEAIDYFAGQDITTFEIEPIEWPYPTLMRYHLFLQQEEYLKKFDKLLYLDADMKVVADIDVGIFGEGLTCAKHPMYALDRRFIPPYEPNPNSSAYVPRFGQILTDNKGKIWFDPIYAAGGIQGGATEPFIEAMWWMKRSIDRDLQNNYTAIWNDESHWNAYLYSHPNDALIVLEPGYVYPDSLIESYYVPVWGKRYQPKIITITKKHSLSWQGGAEILKHISGDGITVCPTCGGGLNPPPDTRIVKVLSCQGPGKNHDCEMVKLA